MKTKMKTNPCRSRVAGMAKQFAFILILGTGLGLTSCGDGSDSDNTDNDPILETDSTGINDTPIEDTLSVEVDESLDTIFYEEEALEQE